MVGDWEGGGGYKRYSNVILLVLGSILCEDEVMVQGSRAETMVCSPRHSGHDS